jgi:hypothetical protein
MDVAEVARSARLMTRSLALKSASRYDGALQQLLRTVDDGDEDERFDLATIVGEQLFPAMQVYERNGDERNGVPLYRALLAIRH